MLTRRRKHQMSVDYDGPVIASVLQHMSSSANNTNIIRRLMNTSLLETPAHNVPGDKDLREEDSWEIESIDSEWPE
jgi:hypothetical protein